jgi:flagellar biosynthetic protein FliP
MITRGNSYGGFGRGASERGPLPVIGAGRALSLLVLLILLLIGPASAAASTGIPAISIQMGQEGGPGAPSLAMQIVVLLTVLSLAPALFVMVTSFTRIVIVLAFLRQAMGTQQVPPNQVLIGLSMFLTFFIMAPVWDRIQADAIEPYLSQKVSQEEALTIASKPLRQFMLKQAREKDLALFIRIAKLEPPRTPDDIPLRIVIPSYIVGELRTAFQVGFLISIPFLIVDMVVASVLMSMGMMLLPPILVSLPFKLILFVLADGWHLVVGSLVGSFLL